MRQCDIETCDCPPGWCREGAEAKAVRADGLSPDEGEVMDKLVEAHHRFMLLDAGHPDERREWGDAFHRLQSLLATRAMRRLFPGGWS